MIEKRTTLDQIELTRNGTTQVRIALELVEEGVILSNKWHRTVIELHTNVDEQMAIVNRHLIEMGENPVSVEDVEKIKAHHFLR